MTPDALLKLGRQPPAFDDPARSPNELRAFWAHYGLDFGAEYPAADYRGGSVDSGPYRVMLHRWLQPGARSNLLLVHGFTDHSGLFGKLVAYGLARGDNVLIYDQPGHGLSSGEPCSIDDFDDYSRALAAVLASAGMPDLPCWVMAQSMGAAALMQFGRHYPWPFSATVLLAPLVRPAGWRGIQLAHTLLRRFVHSVPRRFSDSSSDPAFVASQRSDPLQSTVVPVRWVGAMRRWQAGLPGGSLDLGPALVLQGDRDDTVDWRYNMVAIARLFPGSRIEYLEGAGHHLANESEALRRRYLDLVDAYVAPLLGAAEPV